MDIMSKVKFSFKSMFRVRIYSYTEHFMYLY